MKFQLNRLPVELHYRPGPNGAHPVSPELRPQERLIGKHAKGASSNLVSNTADSTKGRRHSTGALAFTLEEEAAPSPPSTMSISQSEAPPPMECQSSAVISEAQPLSP